MVAFDGRVLILRWMDPEVQGRYGTMVYVRCGPEGAKRAGQAEGQSRAKPKAAPKPIQPPIQSAPPPPPPTGDGDLLGRSIAGAGLRA